MNSFDVVVVGGGQSALAVGYYLHRSGLTYIIVDDQPEAGGAWLHTWKSLRLFSPAQWSSLPGTIMPGGSASYPTRDVVIEYLKQYELKYGLHMRRPVHVNEVVHQHDEFVVHTSEGDYHATAIVSATGSFAHPYIPPVTGMAGFAGAILHSSQYQSPEPFAGKKVAIVGEGNSGAQILSEVSTVADTIWITRDEPRFLPDHVDGRFLFDAATQIYEAQKSGTQYKPPSLGDIVMVETVKHARARKVMENSLRPFDHFTHDSIVWSDGRVEKIDAVIFCTGFKPELKHLNSLSVVNTDGKASTLGTRSATVDGLWFVGYGHWTGFASATLIGVGRTAKATVEEIKAYVGDKKSKAS